jgi:SHOCT-like domain
MADDALERILRLVAEGRLSAEEAAPILAALDETGDRGTGSSSPGPGPGRSGSSGSRGTGSGARGAGDGAPRATGDHATSLRIEVSEHGRQVVSLRLPVALGRFALDRVPGLSGDQVDRVREALGSGLRGPVLEVDDDDGRVRIVLE